MALGRGFGAVVGSTLVCALLAGCTSSDPERNAADPSPSSVTTTRSSTAPVTITLGVYGPPGSVEAYEALTDAFTDANPQVEIEVEKYEDAERLRDAVRGGDSPDVFVMDHDHLPQLVAEDLVQPVDGLLEERQVDFGDGYQRSGLTAFAADAALQCMPHDVSPLVVYYNRDIVDLERVVADDEAPPNALDGWSWETFDAVARAASRGPGHGVYIDPSLMSLAPFIWSAGGDIVDEYLDPSTLTLSGGDSQEALEVVLPLVRDPQVTPTEAQLARLDAATRFERGRLGMILGTRELTPAFRAAESLDFDVMPLPSLGRFRTVTDMTGYCVARDTENLDAAGDLLAFAVGREGASITARSGFFVPSNLEVANSPAFAQSGLAPESAFVFNEGVRRAQSMPYAPGWAELTEQIAPSLDEMFYAPVIDLDLLLEEIDAGSAEVLAPEED